jgi:hypothetical protein
MEEEVKNKLEWDLSIPLYNRFIALDCLKAFGIPVLFIASVILIASKGDISFDGFQYALILVGILAVLTIFLLWIIYRNKFEYHFIVDTYGVKISSQGSTRKKNITTNNLLITLGILTGKPGSVGTGMIVNSMQDESMQWNEVFKVVPFPRNHAIVLRNSWRQVAIIYCTKENYSEVLDYANKEFNERKSKRIVDMKSIKRERIFILAMIPFALITGFCMTAIYEYYFDNKIVVILLTIWMLLTIIFPGNLRKIFAIIGSIFVLGFLLYGLFDIFSGYYNSYDNVRLIFFSLGCTGMFILNWICYRRKIY